MSPTPKFEVAYPPGRLDLRICLTSGMVFRWEQLPGGDWIGVDGPNWYLIKDENPLQVISNATAEAFERFFRLDWDAAEVERDIVAREPAMVPYMESARGLRVMRPSDPEETFFCFLCTPNNNVKRITQMIARLAAYGPVIGVVEGRELRRFPSASVVAAIPEEELRRQGFGYRGATIPRAAGELLERGPEWLESLKLLTYGEAHDALVQISGIGPKLADCICLFGLDHSEAVPVDTHVWQAATRVFLPEWSGKAITSLRYREAGDALRSRFGKLAGWAHQYLFYENMLNWRARRGQT